MLRAGGTNALSERAFGHHSPAASADAVLFTADGPMSRERSTTRYPYAYQNGNTQRRQFSPDGRILRDSEEDAHAADAAAKHRRLEITAALAAVSSSPPRQLPRPSAAQTTYGLPSDSEEHPGGSPAEFDGRSGAASILGSADRWLAFVWFKGEEEDAGRLSDEAQASRAAHAADAAVRRMAADAKKLPRPARFRGVYWNKHAQKWHAQIKHERKQIHIGSFVNEEDAARAVDAAFAERGRPVVNAAVLSGAREHPPKQGGSSAYSGVAYVKKKRKWRAEFTHKTKKITVGVFCDESDAAKAVDDARAELGLPRLNAQLLAQAAAELPARAPHPPRAPVGLGAPAAAAAAAPEHFVYGGSAGASASPAGPSEVRCAVVERSGPWPAFLRSGKTIPVGAYASKADATAAAAAARVALLPSLANAGGGLSASCLQGPGGGGGGGSGAKRPRHVVWRRDAEAQTGTASKRPRTTDHDRSGANKQKKAPTTASRRPRVPALAAGRPSSASSSDLRRGPRPSVSDCSNWDFSQHGSRPEPAAQAAPRRPVNADGGSWSQEARPPAPFALLNCSNWDFSRHCPRPGPAAAAQAAPLPANADRGSSCSRDGAPFAYPNCSDWDFSRGGPRLPAADAAKAAGGAEPTSAPRGPVVHAEPSTDDFWGFLGSSRIHKERVNI